MKGDTVISLNVLEIDMLIHILDEVVSSQKIPEVITEEIRQELFAELDITKILTDLKTKLGVEKFKQIDDVDTNQGTTYAINLLDSEIDWLRNGDYGEVEIIVENILKQVKEQEA